MTAKMHRDVGCKTQGFTLIEIMVVVVILGILAALIAPNVISRIDDAVSRSQNSRPPPV